MKPSSNSLPISLLLSRVSVHRKNGDNYMAVCPAHTDREASLSISQGEDGRVLLKCFAGCTVEEIVKSLGLEIKSLFPQVGRGVLSSDKKTAHLYGTRKSADNKGESLRNADCTPSAHPLHTGCTLQEYADTKKLPITYLRTLGLSDIIYQELSAVRIPYCGGDGNETGAVRIRRALQKGEDADNRFAWKKGSRLSLYGLNRKYAEKYRILCEGESDCHTLWFHNFPAVGIPGADNWKENRDASYFEEIDPIYVIVEPDHGGEAVKKWLSRSRIRARARLISLGEHKDPSGLYLGDPEHFRERFQDAMNRAIPWTELEASEGARIKVEAWSQCRTLAESGGILEAFIHGLSRLGLVGEEKISKILYLCLVSRFLPRLVSAVLKGPSSGGKSFLVDSILKFFPPAAFYALTSMSEHSLAYSDEPLKNRFLVLYEAAGLNSELASYLLRSLLSEGRVRYETVEKTKDGLKPRLIEREGPTGAIITTTAVRLHPENETRLLSMTVSDTPEQTRRVMLALAEDAPGNEIDFDPWHALQVWLENSEHRVAIPFSKKLAEKVPPVAVRLRRDFTTVLNLIRANAILNQAKRGRAEDGAIIATLEDYSTIRGLVIDFISEGIGATVPMTIRETVAAVAGVIEGGGEHATVAQVAQRLNLDRSAASRRISAAIEKGYLVNTEKKRGNSLKIILGDYLPEELEVLPPPEKLEVCSRAAAQEGVKTPPPPLLEHPISLLEGII